MESDIITRQQQDAMDRCITCNIPFALYALPGATEMTFIASHPTDDEYLNNHPSVPGAFAINFFNRENPYPIVVMPEMTAAQVLALPSSTHYPDADITPSPRSVSAVTYMAQVHEMVRKVKRSHGKVVLSRIIAGHTDRRSVAAMAMQYFAGRENTLRYIFFTQETGLWLGSTPELLVGFTTGNDGAGVFRTMSLAGTRPASSSTPDEEHGWDDKNIGEQQLVTDAVVKALADADVDEITATRSTLRVGNVEHICTEITATTTPGQALALTETLDPTPAVCGTPREEALRLISRYEVHERLCYAGTVTVQTCGNFGWQTFVNLRCAFLAPVSHDNLKKGYTYNIYAGGGITPLSTPDGEWMETQLKAEPLRLAITGEPRGSLNDLLQQLSEESTI